MIVVLRHGQTEWNDKKLTQGHLDIPLNNTGREQAARIRDWFKQELGKPDAVYASDLTRAVETAAIAFPYNEIIEDSRLREQNFGDQQGTNREEWFENNPEARELKESDDPYSVRWPNGESTHDVRDRVFEAFNEIMESHNTDEVVAVIGHATPLICTQVYFDLVQSLSDADVFKNGEGVFFDCLSEDVSRVTPLNHSLY